MVSLRDFLGRKPVVRFFYPRDSSLGCAKRARAFRDDLEKFRDLAFSAETMEGLTVVC
jgi:peroxiredoxin